MPLDVLPAPAPPRLLLPFGRVGAFFPGKPRVCGDARVTTDVCMLEVQHRAFHSREGATVVFMADGEDQ